MVEKLKNLKKRLGKWFWVILVVIIVAVGFFFFKSRNKEEVITGQIGRGLVKEELILTGSINATKYASLAFPISGKIAWVSVSEGQKVNQGQALTSLDKTVLNTVYQQALNTYKNYQAAAESALDSVKDHSGDESFTQKATRTAAEVARDNAYDSVKAAEYNLKNSTIYAPFSGIVTSLPFTSPGVNVSLTDTQVVILDPSTIYFDVDADQGDVKNISVGQLVGVILDSYSDKEINGKVSFVSFTPKSGATGTNYRVKVEFDKATLTDIMPRIGMTGDAKFILSQKEEVFFVPSEFVKNDIKGRYLKVGKPSNKVYIDVGLESEERVEILSDKVREGDVVYE